MERLPASAFSMSSRAQKHICTMPLSKRMTVSFWREISPSPKMTIGQSPLDSSCRVVRKASLSTVPRTTE